MSRSRDVAQFLGKTDAANADNLALLNTSSGVDSAEVVTLITANSNNFDSADIQTISAPLTNKNLIINGAVQIAQRGTNSGITSGALNFGPDRFKMQLNDLGTWELSQSTTVPTGEGFTNSLKLNCTTADTSVAAGSYLILQQLIEGTSLQHLKWGTSSAEALVWSFWIRSTKTGTFSVEFQHQNSSSTYYNRGSTFTVSSSNTWEKKTITVPANTAQDIKPGAVDGLYVTFWLTAGSNWTGGTHKTDVYSTGAAANTRVSSSVPNHADSTSNEIYITGMQLEIGSTATAFEHEDVATTLAKCKRYYQRYDRQANYAGLGLAVPWSTTAGNIPWLLEVQPAKSPTVSYNALNQFDYFGVTGTGSSGNPTAIGNGGWAGGNSLDISFTGSGFVVARAMLFEFNATGSDAFLAFESEL